MISAVQKQRAVIGISGASGVIYGVRSLNLLREAGIETHLVLTPAAERTIAYETDLKVKEVQAAADVVHPYTDIGASIASGSFPVLGMIVAPASVRSMSEIATGVTSNLLSRAADVMLKERRRLILMVRETPFHLGHLRTMTALTEMGAIIAPPLPAFYAQPQSIDEMVDQSVARAIELLGISPPRIKRWGKDILRGRPKSATPKRGPKV